MKILLATNNENKYKEIYSKFKEQNLPFELLSLNQVTNEKIEIEETGSSLEENALIKAREVYNLFKIPTIADDTGLEVEALGGLPGVNSARFSGVHGNDAENRKKLLGLLKDFPLEKRNARFRTVICLYDGTEPKFFEGVCKGKIIFSERGSKGFGYDSIFVPENYEKTFAEMELGEKNRISHRSKAISLLIDYLKHYR
ncbi:RdgB/HAM1 family non-canonical purine NTP pyrophosphatase [Bacteroidetes/Chlorobi group bacterium MS-B_bin-24]|jgi:XTP/dITP diphosphohydrolase|nr:MAG: RdgB/HAM1 family non-canonical purine NTP pyrophosphatase [Bacteroidetes/Chlorobi group bacterium MS-B_bin-24]